MSWEKSVSIQLEEFPRDGFYKKRWRCLTHGDADGIVSAWICKKADILAGIEFPEEFGDYHGKTADLMLDMRPVDPEFVGVVIDHHLEHPSERKYKLIWGNAPTTFLCYELFKDKIPEDELWKVAIGIAGDGQPELIPLEIIDRYPELFYQDVYFGWKDEFSILLCFRGSSLINACCRLNSPTLAFERLDKAKTLMDLISDSSLRSSLEELRRLRSNAEKKMRVIRGSKAYYVEIESPARIEGMIAQSLMEKTSATVICLNKETMKFSIRGYLALWYCKLLREVEGITCGGHAKYVGGKIATSKYFDFRKRVMKLL